MEKSAELRELTLNFYKAMETADMDFFKSCFSQEDGVLAIGTDLDEWWKGHDTVTHVFEVQLQEMEGLSIVNANPQAFSEGNVGWVADQFELKLADGDGIPFRATTVCHKEAGTWKVVQWHASLGVPNEQVLGQELPPE